MKPSFRVLIYGLGLLMIGYLFRALEWFFAFTNQKIILIILKFIMPIFAFFVGFTSSRIGEWIRK